MKDFWKRWKPAIILTIVAIVFITLCIFVGRAQAEPRLAWDAPPGAVDGYCIRYAQGTLANPDTNQAGEPLLYLHCQPGPATEMPLSNLNVAPLKTYEFGAFAFNRAGPSPLSNLVQYTAPGYTPPPDVLPPPVAPIPPVPQNPRIEE